MQTFIALLRGINVSKKSQIKMDDLKALFGEAGGSEVRTYIQSGNVVFQHLVVDTVELSRLLEQAILKKYAFEVPVIIRTGQQIQQVLEKNPFWEESEIDREQLYVSFLGEEPTANLVEKTKALQFEPDQFVIAGREVYVYCPGGYGRTRLNNTFFENKLKVKATTRNLRTLRTLVEMAQSAGQG